MSVHTKDDDEADNAHEGQQPGESARVRKAAGANPDSLHERKYPIEYSGE